MKQWAWIALLGIGPHVAAAPVDDLLTLYTHARANYPTLQRAAAQTRLASADVDAARAPLLPQWQLNVSQQRAGGAPSYNTTSSKITQSVVDVAARANLNAARAEANAQDANFHVAKQALLAELAIRYFDMLTAESQLATYTANEAAFAELVRQSEVRVAEGLSAAADVDQARAALGLAQAITQQAKEALADARQALQQLVGRAPEQLKHLKKKWQPAVLQPDPQADTLADHPQLQAGDASISAAKERIHAAQAGHLPTLALTVTSERAPRDYQAPRTSTHSAVGLQLSIPLMMGGATLAQERQAVARRDIEIAQVEMTRRDITRNMKAQWEAAQGSITQIKIIEAGAAAAERALAAIRSGQQIGTRTLTDVLNAIQTNGQAQLQLTQARHRHVVALLLLKQAGGRLTVDDLAAINTLLE
ncbi:TolC family outer membrane protein [Massilia sp. CCM 9210]|uniref:TolC family outer membrane protein n=1 Tax=Massilia scottii TaxID=3057166 RepID=UPI002796C882|nr:TolC family outer membrane protein [Massilia sp. CCM 9210]MDQ1816196.1 TolC family outer membrane protein [Massilia sp. CCM 9210]